MILAEDEVDLGTDHDGIMVLDDALEPGTPLADVLPLVEEVLEIEPTGNRPDLLSVYGIAREVAAILDGELLPMPGNEAACTGDDAVDVRVEDAAGCPRYIGRLFRDVTIGPVAALAARTAARGRRALDLQRRRRDELRDARARQPAARVRLRHAGGRPRHRAPRARGRGAAHARRDAAQARPRRPAHRRREARDRARRDHGRRGDRGRRDDDVGAARGGELRAGRDPAELRAARAAHRGLEPVGEGRRSLIVAGPAATLATQLIVELAGARWTGDTDVQAGMPAQEIIELRPERTDAVLGLEVPRLRAGRDPQQARLRRRPAERLPRADVARARRDARDRPRSRRSRASR